MLCERIIIKLLSSHENHHNQIIFWTGNVNQRHLLLFRLFSFIIFLTCDLLITMSRLIVLLMIVTYLQQWQRQHFVSGSDVEFERKYRETVHRAQCQARCLNVVSLGFAEKYFMMLPSDMYVPWLWLSLFFNLLGQNIKLKPVIVPENSLKSEFISFSLRWICCNLIYLVFIYVSDLLFLWNFTSWCSIS